MFQDSYTCLACASVKKTCNQFGQGKVRLMKHSESVGWRCNLDKLQLHSFQNVAVGGGNAAMAFQTTDGYSILRYSIQIKDTRLCAC